jgi:transposase InsO family protein
MADNGGYQSTLHAIRIAELGIKHLRTRPYRQHINGKAERFIQALQRGMGIRGQLSGSPPSPRGAAGAA